MLEYDEKRNSARVEVDFDITYKLADSNQTFQGQCKSISGAGVSFITDQDFAPGKAMEINVMSKNSAAPPMTAFIEIVRCTKQNDSHYEIAATIKSIKGN